MRTLRIAGLAAVAMVACLIWAGPAQATGDYVTLEWKSCQPTEAVTAYAGSGTYNPLTSSYTSYTALGSWYCGQYNLQVTNSADSYGGDGKTLVDKAYMNTPPIVGSYCIDVHQEAPGTYRVYDIYPLASAPIPGIGMGSTKADDLQRLFSFLQDPLPNTSPNQANKLAGAFQAAVWEIVNETSGTYNVFNGSFKMTEYNIGNGTGWLAQANVWLNALHDPGTVPVKDVVALVNTSAQDYALTIKGAGSTDQIPEPVTMAGVLFGIGGLVGYVRRRRAA
jgi:hypothetical protein